MLTKNSIISKEMAVGLAVTLIVNCIAYYISRILVGTSFHHDISMVWDERIPLCSWTIVIYWGAFLFWIINYIIGVRQDENEAYKFLCADVTAKIICFIIFVVFPTTNIRPEITGTGIFDWSMKFLYQIDAADNLFPSIHCLTSWFSFIAVRKNPKISNWYKIFSFIIAIAICISTLTTKQHVLWDTVAGVGLAELMYQLVDRIGLTKNYMKCIKNISGKILKNLNW